VPVRDTPVVDTALLAALRADLGAADFTLDAVAASLGPVAVAALRREQALPADLGRRGRRGTRHTEVCAVGTCRKGPTTPSGAADDPLRGGRKS